MYIISNLIFLKNQHFNGSNQNMKFGLLLNTISWGDYMSRIPTPGTSRDTRKLPPRAELASPFAKLRFSKHLWFKVLQLMLFTVVRYSNSGVPHLRDPGA